jgi:uncharacterized protein YdaU (DUF1376 family)
MALRDQPYIPLYVQDFLTDEKLMECSASTTGIYIKIMCVMHKSEEYGTILLKQKDKQSDNQIKNFASKIAKYLPYSIGEITEGITELVNEKVLQIDGDKLLQKRMVKDNTLSIARAKAGKKGGMKNPFAKPKEEANKEAKPQANTEDEDVNKNLVNYKGVLENFHFYCNKLSKIERLSTERKKHINARFKEFDYDTIIAVFKIVGKSDFLCGKNDRAWKANFDWIFNETNFLKIMEGKYENQEPKVITRAFVPELKPMPTR